MKYKTIYIFLLLAYTSFFSCKSKSDNRKEIAQKSIPVVNARETAVLEISFVVNEQAYRMSNFGESPQVAVWLENRDSSFYKTVWVTRRAGQNDWLGKVECPVALPRWDSRRKASGENTDAVSGATVKNGIFKTRTHVLPAGKYRCYIEVNASGDYSERFSYWSRNGAPDTEGNGQPSLVYAGWVDLESNKAIQPGLIGRTHQFRADGVLYVDTLGFSTAKHLLSNISIRKMSK